MRYDMNSQNLFGEFVREKRLQAGVNLRKLAEILDIAPAYMSDIENGHRYPPEKEKLYTIADTLHLSKEDTDKLFDLAGGTKKNNVSPDIADYIMEQNNSRIALRIARDKNFGEKEWEKVIQLLEKESNDGEKKS